MTEAYVNPLEQYEVILSVNSKCKLIECEIIVNDFDIITNDDLSKNKFIEYINNEGLHILANEYYPTLYIIDDKPQVNVKPLLKFSNF